MPAKFDTKVFRDLSYGLYLVTTRNGDRTNGQIVNTVMQVTSEPPRIAVIINKKNLTHDMISRSLVFAASVLGESVTMPFLGPFGFKSGREVDKLAGVKHKTGVTGCPLVLDHTLSAIEARVVSQVDLGAHTVFIADVAATEVFNEGSPLTYRFYHENLRGKAPPNAPSYTAPA